MTPQLLISVCLYQLSLTPFSFSQLSFPSSSILLFSLILLFLSLLSLSVSVCLSVCLSVLINVSHLPLFSNPPSLCPPLNLFHLIACNGDAMQIVTVGDNQVCVIQNKTRVSWDDARKSCRSKSGALPNTTVVYDKRFNGEKLYLVGVTDLGPSCSIHDWRIKLPRGKYVFFFTECRLNAAYLLINRLSHILINRPLHVAFNSRPSHMY